MDIISRIRAGDMASMNRFYTIAFQTLASSSECPTAMHWLHHSSVLMPSSKFQYSGDLVHVSRDLTRIHRTYYQQHCDL
jgi:hypothetical protein